MASVVIFSRGGARTLARVLEGLRTQTVRDFEYEIILVSSGDNGAGAAVARPFADALPIEVVDVHQGLTIGAARNIGINRSRGRFVMFLEDDCIPHAEWMSRRLQRHLEGFPLVAEAVGCAQPRSVAARLQWLTRFSGSTATGRPRLGITPMAKWSYERSLLDRGFNEDLLRSVDIELNAALIAAGYRVLYDPAIRTDHIGLPRIRDVYTHNYRHGAGAAHLAKHQDAAWVASRYARPGLLLLYPPARWMSTFRNVLRSDPSTIANFLLLTPLALVAYAHWAAGFRSVEMSDRRARANPAA